MKKNKLFLIVLTLIMSACFLFAFIGCSKNTDCAHEWQNTSARTEPTCTENGNQEQKCAKCGGVQTIEIPALEHAFAETWLSDENGHWHECTREGCTATQSEANHADSDNDHKCDICDNKFSDCANNNSDHKCDTCGKKLSDCADTNNDHKCDICQNPLSKCADTNKDGKCDICENDFCNCEDSNNDHHCDICNKKLTDHIGGTATCIAQALCSICSQAYGELAPHDWAEATCTAPKTCTTCNKTEGEALGHDWTGNDCSRCDEKKYYTRSGNKITFGTYPQSKVTDENIVATLTELAGELPTSEDSKSWTSYGYYMGSSVKNYTWYTDVTVGGEKYRGVYFTEYRPFKCGYTDTSSAMQQRNGYNTNTLYWFKFEPISWTILSESDGSALIFCDMIVDSQQYDYTSTYYENNYADSTIRAWLNDNFYNTAFSALLQEIILTTEVDNSESTTGYDENEWACANTFDKVFLLSNADVINPDYGFDSDEKAKDAARSKQVTDYAQAQGAQTSTSDMDYPGTGFWWTRSPSTTQSNNYASVIPNAGYLLKSGNPVYFCNAGVVPALQIQL